jgi:hypothetical protein
MAKRNDMQIQNRCDPYYLDSCGCFVRQRRRQRSRDHRIVHATAPKQIRHKKPRAVPLDMPVVVDQPVKRP